MDTVQVPEQSSSTSSYYTWEVPGKKTSIYLDFGVVDRLLVEVMRGFGAIPRRGAEVGGILLGSAEMAGERTVIRVEEFEPIVCEHRRGPSYLLSEADTSRYEEAILRHRFSPDKRVYAVGCYRSHTREGMALSPEDLEHFNKYFPDQSSAFLMVKPFATRVSMAGFFFREEGGRIRSESPYQEFPFRRRELGGGTSPGIRNRDHGHVASAMSSPASQPAEARPVTEEPPAPDSEYENYPLDAAENDAYEGYPPEAPARDHEASTRRFRKTNVWIPLSFIFLLLGTLVGFQVALSYKPAKAAGALNDPYKLSLGVSRAGDNLHIRWDRQSQAVRASSRGLLIIEDGTYKGTVDLDVMQLQNPNVYYRHLTDFVKFRLEVFTKERNSVIETIEWRK